MAQRLTMIGMVAAVLGYACVAWAGPSPEVEILRHKPCNLFSPDDLVQFEVQLKGFADGRGEVEAVGCDYHGQKIWEKKYPVEIYGGQVAKLNATLGKPGRGYFTLKVYARVQGGNGSVQESKENASFGVMEPVRRSAAEVRGGGYRFGLKWWGGVPDKAESEEAMVRLGLQWTRIIINQGGDFSTAKMLTDFPMNAVIKIERFPKELFDEQRYGPLAEWEKKYGRGAWMLKTLPQKEAYQQLLHRQLAALPAEQNVFEIWNEPWDKMSPEDFATLCQWIAEVVLKERPNAILGPNLVGSSSPYEYDARVIKAGGMKGMKMVALHPYSVSEDREWLRGYRRWLKESLGHDMQVYITEYGSHSTPQGPAKRSEEEQAERVVRQSLALYAEGVSALTPHWLGQTEKNPTYVEDWFGFIRKNEQPKPVLIAHANCARLIDGSRYVGDLWFGPRVEAMLFEKKGSYVLALWTLREGTNDAHAEKEIEVDGVKGGLSLVDMVGKETKVLSAGGKLRVKVGEFPVYLVGGGPELAKAATQELRADRWPKPPQPPRNIRTIHRMKASPQVDGHMEGWKGATQFAVLNPKVNGDDASGMGYMAWDDQFLYIAVEMRDNELLNVQPRAKLYRQDSIELFVSTEPRDTGSGYGPNDHQLYLTATSAEGKALVCQVADRESGKVEDITGARYFGGRTATGWVLQVAIPWAHFAGFQANSGAKAALELRVNDADSSHERFKIDPIDIPESSLNPSNPSTWSLLQLED